jgi:hypothetical protein
MLVLAAHQQQQLHNASLASIAAGCACSDKTSDVVVLFVAVTYAHCGVSLQQLQRLTLHCPRGSSTHVPHVLMSLLPSLALPCISAGHCRCRRLKVQLEAAAAGRAISKQQHHTPAAAQQ